MGTIDFLGLYTCIDQYWPGSIAPTTDLLISCCLNARLPSTLPPMAKFQLGESYTRRDIHAELGGGLVPFLPNVNGVVVAACLRIDTNPDAPHVVLPGVGPRIRASADLFSCQSAAVPTFLKES